MYLFLEKNLCPPISILLPLKTSVLEIPPMNSLSSIIKGFILVSFKSLYAAVRPAGPAPIMIAVFWLLDFSI